MKQFTRRSIATVVGTGLLVLGSASAAFAGSNGSVSATTHAHDHADTTSVEGPCTTPSINGPVWAYDNLSFKVTATPEAAPNTWSVVINANGSFQAFADPNTGACVSTNGSVDGSLQYDVTSPNQPDPKNVPSQEDPSTSQGQIVSQLFDGAYAIVGGGHYDYVYNRIDGVKYEQVG